MSIIVQKFGGTSVADIQRIKNVADIVQSELQNSDKVVVVLSAMSGVTDHLISLTNDIDVQNNPASQAEHDVVVSTGEQITVGLLAIALQNMGIKARSLLSWQIPIITDDSFARSRIESIDSDIINHELKDHEVVIIPGFQGITEGNRVTTLGRGGSDTSAVAIAASLNAKRCDIYTDVEGVYTSDPRIVSKARKLNKIGYEEVLEMASLGAKVLHTRCVEMAMKEGVQIQVRSSFSKNNGTLLVEEEEIMERRLVTGIAYSRNDAQITLSHVEHTPGVAADIFGPLAEADINVDMIVQSISEDGKETNITFTIPQLDLDKAIEKIENSDIKYKSLISDCDVAKISVIGVGMRSHAGLAQKMFQTLADKNINIHVISTSEIKISVLVSEEYLELALRALHTAYDLDGE